MKSISELISRAIKAEHIRLKEKAATLSAPIALGNKTARYATYEVEVFNFLLRFQRDRLLRRR